MSNVWVDAALSRRRLVLAGAGYLPQLSQGLRTQRLPEVRVGPEDKDAQVCVGEYRGDFA
jgi:hypothetical protein